MAKHTPGPWQVSRTLPEGRLVIECVDGTQDIAFVEGFGFLRNKAGSGELGANARLIAAAPELLAAAKAAFTRFREDKIEGHHTQHPVTLLDAAIAKAEGRG